MSAEDFRVNLKVSGVTGKKVERDATMHKRPIARRLILATVGLSVITILVTCYLLGQTPDDVRALMNEVTDVSSADAATGDRMGTLLVLAEKGDKVSKCCHEVIKAGHQKTAVSELMDLIESKRTSKNHSDIRITFIALEALQAFGADADSATPALADLGNDASFYWKDLAQRTSKIIKDKARQQPQ